MIKLEYGSQIAKMTLSGIMTLNEQVNVATTIFANEIWDHKYLLLYVFVHVWDQIKGLTKVAK